MNNPMSLRTSTTALVLAVLVLVSLACGSIPLPKLGSGGGAGPLPTGPGEEITLSNSLQIEGIPQSVIPYGGGQSVTLTDLKLKKSDSGISGDVQFTSNQKEEFALIVYITMPKRLLVVYFDSKANEAYTTPAAPDGSNVLFTVPGYELKGGGNEGTIHFYVISRAYGMYDITGQKGKVYVFCVKPKEAQSQGAFQAISNVIEVDMDF
jgi:hypothetical protein